MEALTRDEEIVAMTLFCHGTKTKLTFQRPHIIHPRTRTAIDGLLAKGMIETLPKDELAVGAEGWCGTEKIGVPFRKFKMPEKAESWPITTE